MIDPILNAHGLAASLLPDILSSTTLAYFADGRATRTGHVLSDLKDAERKAGKLYAALVEAVAHVEGRMNPAAGEAEMKS